MVTNTCFDLSDLLESKHSDDLDKNDEEIGAELLNQELQKGSSKDDNFFDENTVDDIIQSTLSL